MNPTDQTSPVAIVSNSPAEAVKTIPVVAPTVTSSVGMNPPPNKPSSRIESIKNRYKKFPKKMKLLIILGGITFVLLLLSTLSSHPQSSTSAGPSPTPTLTPLPIVTSGPTYTPVPTNKVTPIPTAWTIFPNNGHLAQFGITLSYPFGWTVKYKMNTSPGTAATALDMDFLPANTQPNSSSSANMGWGGITIYLYPQASGIDDWLSTNFPTYTNNYTIPQQDSSSTIQTQISDIVPTTGNLPTLYVSPGSNNFYLIRYAQYGIKGSTDIIHSLIFPSLHID